MPKRLLLNVLKMHKKIIIKDNSADGIRDMGLLESAIYSPFQTFGGKEIYPNPIEKAALLAFKIIKNHPFVDGNKRTGIVAMFLCLKMYKIKIISTEDEEEELVYKIVEEKENYHIIEWLKERII